MIPAHHAQEPLGAIASARAGSGHVTPAEGFALDADALDRLTEMMLERAALEDWSVDISPDDEP